MNVLMDAYAYQHGVPKDQLRCCDSTHFECLSADQFFTEVNPPGGYGRPQLLICDECMRSGRWDNWKKEHWPNWPEDRNG